MMFLRCSILLFMALGSGFCSDVFEGSFTVTVPGDRLLEKAELGVSFDGIQSVVKEERHHALSPTSMVQIGNLPQITLKKNYKGRMRLKDSKKRSIKPWFYLYSMASHLQSVEIEPSYYSKGNEFHTNSKTDPVFRILFYEVDRVGEVQGKEIKVLENVQFEIGKKNTFPVNLKIEKDKKLAVSIEVDSEETHYLHLKSRKEGKYPFLLSNREGTYYNGPIQFRFESKLDQVQRERDLVHHKLVKEINQFVRSHSDFGTSRVIEVPVQLKLQLAPKSKIQSALLIDARAGEKNPDSGK